MSPKRVFMKETCPSENPVQLVSPRRVHGAVGGLHSQGFSTLWGRCHGLACVLTPPPSLRVSRSPSRGALRPPHPAEWEPCGLRGVRGGGRDPGGAVRPRSRVAPAACLERLVYVPNSLVRHRVDERNLTMITFQGDMRITI